MKSQGIVTKQMPTHSPLDLSLDVTTSGTAARVFSVPCFHIAPASHVTVPGFPGSGAAHRHLQPLLFGLVLVLKLAYTLLRGWTSAGTFQSP